MQIIKSIIIAFSMYSRIPMPQFSWEKEDMKYVMCFFPWVGAVIGGMVYLWKVFCSRAGVGRLCDALIGTAIPLLITGGFHVDGFLDTMDAFHSYQPKERKLEILKDSHIGAFAVIMFAVYGLIYIGAYSELISLRLVTIGCAGFVLARCLSGIGVVTFSSARNNGLLFWFASNAHKHIVRVCLYLQSVLCIGFMCYQSVFAGGLTAIVAVASFGYYFFRCRKEFGGITGDTAGYFVLICEECMIVTLAVINLMDSGI